MILPAGPAVRLLGGHCSRGAWAAVRQVPLDQRNHRTVGVCSWDYLGVSGVCRQLADLPADQYRAGPRQLATYGETIAVAFVATLLGRAIAVYRLISLLRGEPKIPRAHRPVFVWGGLRGTVSLALVLSILRTLPMRAALPNRDLLQQMAFGVVAVSLLLHRTTMPLLIRRLRLVKPNVSIDQVPILRTPLHAVKDALLALSHKHAQGHIDALPYERLIQANRREQARLEQQLNDLRVTSAERTEDESAETAPTGSRK